MPEKTFSESDMLNILTGVDRIKYETWPGTGTPDVPEVKYAIRPLSREDILKCQASAVTEARKREIEDLVIETATLPNGLTISVKAYDLILRDEMVAVGLRRADNPAQPFFRNVAEARIRLTANEVTRFYEQIINHTQESIPMTVAEVLNRDQDFEEIYQALKKDPGSTILEECAPGMLRAFVRFMVERQSN